jgi:hypothetical protein
MTEPNLDKDIEHILLNVALNGAYEDAGQRVLSQGVIVKANKYIDLIIAQQVKEARIEAYEDCLISDNMSFSNGLDFDYETHIRNRIATLKGEDK